MNIVILTNNIFSFTKLIVSFLIAGQAYILYAKMPRTRLFILGTSFTVAGLTAITELVGNNGFMGIYSYATQWFSDIGLLVAYGFILLCTLSDSSTYLRRVMLGQIVVVGLLLLLLLFIPILPNYPIPAIQLGLGGIRAAICFCVFLLYTSFFVRKASRFNIFMAIAFLLLMLGNTIIIPHYVVSSLSILVFWGNILRTGGFLALFAAFWIK